MAHDEVSCHQPCLSFPPGDSQSLKASKLLLPHIQNFQQQKTSFFQIFMNVSMKFSVPPCCGCGGGGKKNKIIHLKLWGQLIIYRQSFSGIFACLCSFSNSLCMYNQNSIIWHQTFLALEGCCNIKLFRNFGKIHFIQPKLNGFVLLLNIFHF